MGILLQNYMEITKEKRDELEARVESFFKDNKIMREEKIDITRICSNLNIQVASLTFPKELREEIDGLILVKSNEKKIGFNCELDPRRARFVIAHELAHYITQKDHLEFAFRDKIFHGEEKPAEEQEMDYMAAAILVSKDILKVYLKALNLNDNYTKETVTKNVNPIVIQMLADVFFVEKDLICRRIIEVA